MPNPDEPVVLNRGLWDAVAEGLVVSEDLSPSLRLRESFSATLPARVRAAPLQPLPARLARRDGAAARRHAVWSPGAARVVRRRPARSRDGSESSDNVENVELNLCAASCARSRRRAPRTGAPPAKRERALLKVVEGLCEYQRARSPR